MSNRPVIVYAPPPSRIKRKSKLPAKPAVIKPGRVVFAPKPKRKPFVILRPRAPAND